MDLLITLIGNAAVDPIFRAKFLANPLHTADAYQFHLTKGEVDLMNKVFTDKTKHDLDEAFQKLETTLYQALGVPCKKPPCAWSVYPPAELRRDYDLPKAA